MIITSTPHLLHLFYLGTGQREIRTHCSLISQTCLSLLPLLICGKQGPEARLICDYRLVRGGIGSL